MLLAKSFTVPVEPVVKPAAEVTTSQKPFFALVLAPAVWLEKVSGPSLVQTTSEAVEEMQTATQPLEAPGAGTATQPVQAPGSVPNVQPSGEADVSAASDSEGDQHSVTGSLSEENYRYGSPDRDLPREEAADQELSEEANYRETMRDIRSFMGWHKIPEFETVSSSDDNPFAGAFVQPTGKVSVKLPVDDWLCRKMGKLNLTITGGTLQETLTLLVSSTISSSSHPDLPDGMGCILRRRTVRATQYAPGHRNQPNSTIPSVGLHIETFLLPHPPGPSARTCVGREQHVNRRLCVTRLLVCQGV